MLVYTMDLANMVFLKELTVPVLKCCKVCLDQTSTKLITYNNAIRRTLLAVCLVCRT